MDTRTTSAETVPAAFRKKLRSRSAVPAGKSLWHALIGRAVPVLVLGAAPYLVGRVYHTTFLQTVGINPELYPKTSTDYFVHAYYAWLICIGKALPFLTEELIGIVAVVLFWVVITALALASLYIDRLVLVQKIREMLLEAGRFKRATKVVVIPVLGSALTIYIPVLVSFAYIAPVLIGETAAKHSASFYMKKVARVCSSPGAATSYCTEVQESGKLIGYGLVIDASDSNIALLEKGRGRSIQRAGKEFITHHGPVQQ